MLSIMRRIQVGGVSRNAISCAPMLAGSSISLLQITGREAIFETCWKEWSGKRQIVSWSFAAKNEMPPRWQPRCFEDSGKNRGQDDSLVTYG